MLKTLNSDFLNFNIICLLLASLVSVGSRPGHKVSGTQSKFPNLNKMDKNLIVREVFLTQNPVRIFSRSATACDSFKQTSSSLLLH